LARRVLIESQSRLSVATDMDVSETTVRKCVAAIGLKVKPASVTARHARAACADRSHA
jgi:hypothetical protein